ncbi:TIM barrel protein [Antarcticibacterium sp. 1MA-6-2]|uniref:sugar phosphate isomerase/epimerase family protein n=1 Tax=Antarcticibacterium sp. 1MA-6-2 TaxID=2908210 RepID=UPI0028830EB6|nr:TIM barrel protein [Antarcticibacterium sp. 1MA-6-2]
MRSKLTQNLTFLILTLFLSVSIISCKNEEKSEIQDEQVVNANPNDSLFFKISLAQWSLSKPIMEGKIDPMDFAQKANELGFTGIEYVSQLYSRQLEEGGNTPEAMQKLLDSLKSKSEQYNVENVLIMVDGEGDLASPEEEKRNQAVENHKKWVDAAEFLGAHAIRVNLFGTNDPEEWKTAATDGLQKLSDYAAQKNINVLVENHGYLSSNAKLLTEVMESVDRKNA